MSNYKLDLIDYITMPTTGQIVYRIICINEFYNNGNRIHLDDKGGYAYNDTCLHDNTWCYDESIVAGNSELYDESYIQDNVILFNTKLHDDSYIIDNAIINNCNIYDKTVIMNNTNIVCNNGYIKGSIEINLDDDSGFEPFNLSLIGEIKIMGNVMMEGNITIQGKNISITDNVELNNVTITNPIDNTFLIVSISNNAILENVQINGNIMIEEESVIRDSVLNGPTQSGKNLVLLNQCIIINNSTINGTSEISGNSIIKNGAIISNAIVFGDAIVDGSCKISNNVKIYDYATIQDNVIIEGNHIGHVEFFYVADKEIEMEDKYARQHLRLLAPKYEWNNTRQEILDKLETYIREIIEKNQPDYRLLKYKHSDHSIFDLIYVILCNIDNVDVILNDININRNGIERTYQMIRKLIDNYTKTITKYFNNPPHEFMTKLSTDRGVINNGGVGEK